MSPKETGSMTLGQILAGFRKFYDAQEAHRTQETQIWQIERQGLLKRIKELEETVMALVTSAADDTTASAQSKQETSTPKARPVWEGPESIPTRTFSDPAVPQKISSIDNQIPTIEEPSRKKSVGFDPFLKASNTRHTSLSGVDGELVHPDYSGIAIKPSALPAELRKKAEDTVAQGSSSSNKKETDNQIPQVVARPKLLDIPTANMRSEELYSIDAGHTPLARVTGSEGTTGDRTPVQADRPPNPPETQEAPTRPIPSERQDSYFANAQTDGPSDQDTALKEPLNVSDDDGFLDKVNQKLEKQLSQQLDDVGLSPPAEKAEKGHRRVVSEADDGGPKLKLKQSTNFGTPFGQSEPRGM